MKDRLFGRPLQDTAFSVDRLFVWAVGVTLIIGTVTLSLLAYQNKPIAPQVQSLTMVALGAFVGRIEAKLTNS